MWTWGQDRAKLVPVVDAFDTYMEERQLLDEARALQPTITDSELAQIQARVDEVRASAVRWLWR